MVRRYTKVEKYAEEVFRRKAAGETNRQNRKQRAIINGYVPRPKGRPRKDSLEETEESKREKELAKIRYSIGHTSSKNIYAPQRYCTQVSEFVG